MRKDKSEISDLLREVQNQLMRSQNIREEEGLPPLFTLTGLTVEVHFAVVYDDKVDGKIGIHVLQAGAASKVAKTTAHKVTIHLKANDVLDGPNSDVKKLRGSLPSKEI